MSRRLSCTALLMLVACSAETTSPDGAGLLPSHDQADAVGSWVSRAPHPRFVLEAATASITDPGTSRTRLYVIGGKPKEGSGQGNLTNAVREYDASTNKWRTRAAYPVFIRATNSAVELDGKIYVSGGWSRVWDAAHGVYRSDPVLLHHVYDPATNKWTRKRDIPTRSIRGVAAAYQGRIYVATGCQEPTLCGDLPGGGIWRYNPANDRWDLLTRTPADYEVGGFIGGKLYLVTPLGAMDIYDVASNTWSTGPQRPKRRCVQAYATLQAKLYLAGFCNDFDGTSSYPTLIFDPKTGSWTEAASAPAGTREYHALSRVVVNGAAGLDLIGGPQGQNHWRFMP